MALISGDRLGAYELRSKLGEGGMGEVWRARDTRLGRDVAVKVLPAEFAADEGRLRRFEQEARAASSLNHPNVLTLFDVGVERGLPYLVTELLEGETLRSRLQRGRIPWRQALDLGIQILRGLAAAHGGGIVHRDLKPENILVTTDRRAKLLDFGLARLQAPAETASQASSAPTAERTEAGTVLGTVGYMAPEQVRGETADARSDLFAFGCVVLESLTGRRAFQGRGAVETMSAILRDEPAGLDALPATAPAALEPILRRCLEKDPSRRFQAAADLAFALESAAAEPAGGTAPGSRRARAWREWLAWSLAGALGLTTILVAVTGQREPSQARLEPLRFEIAAPAAGAFEKGIALSPDGSRLAFVAPGPNGVDILWIRRLAAFEGRPLAGTEGAAYPFWSPDGARIGFFAGGRLQTIEASGEGVPVIVCRVSSPRGGAWGATGEILFAGGLGGALSRVPAAGGEPSLATHLEPERREFAHRWPSFLPDGRHFLYLAMGAEPDRLAVRLASLDGSVNRRLFAAESGAIFAAPGHLLFRRDGRLVAQPFDRESLRLEGELRQIGEAVWWDGTATAYAAFTASTGGIVAYRPGGLALGRLTWLDRDGREVGSIGEPGAYLEPSLSPDGRRLVVTRGGADFLAAIWVFDLERGSQSRVSSPSVLAVTPAWSSDGRRIAYATFPEGRIYVRDAGGGGIEEPLFEPGAFTPLEDWSRDGRTLLYYSFGEGGVVKAVDLGGDRIPRQVVEDEEGGARLSPDGAWLAYASSASGVPEIFVQPFPGPGERVQVSVSGGTQPRWRGDGRELFYVAPDRKLMAVDVTPGPQLEVGPPRALFSTQILPLVEARNHYDVTADGQRFLVNSRSAEDATRPVRVVVGWSGESP